VQETRADEARAAAAETGNTLAASLSAASAADRVQYEQALDEGRAASCRDEQWRRDQSAREAVPAEEPAPEQLQGWTGGAPLSGWDAPGKAPLEAGDATAKARAVVHATETALVASLEALPAQVPIVMILLQNDITGSSRDAHCGRWQRMRHAMQHRLFARGQRRPRLVSGQDYAMENVCYTIRMYGSLRCRPPGCQRRVAKSAADGSSWGPHSACCADCVHDGGRYRVQGGGCALRQEVGLHRHRPALARRVLAQRAWASAQRP